MACCSALLAWPAEARGAPTENPAELKAPSADLKRLDQDLAGLRQAELSGRADELWKLQPRLTLRAMLLRAGREVPATASAARRAERLVQRETALDWLRSRLASDPQAAKLLDTEARERLAQPDQPVLWCATARCLGRLGLDELAPEIAAQLASTDAQLGLSARLSLFDLYLHWFAGTTEFQTFWPAAQGSCRSSVFMSIARSKEAEARELQIQLLQHEPARATQLLESPDPRLRAAATATLASSDALLDLLARENYALVFNAGLDALLQIQSAAPSTDPELERLRATLVQRIEQGYSDLQAPVADALRRMPWSSEAEGEDSLLAGIAILVGQLQHLADPGQLTDRDVLVTCMSALHTLAARAEQAGLPVQASLEPVAPMLIGMIEESREADRVRIAASEFLPLVGDAVGIERALVVLGSGQSSDELRYNLLAAIGDMAGALEAADPSAQLVLETLLMQVKGDDANLRRRALKYLASPELAPLVALADSQAFVQSLAGEAVPELQIQLLDLIARRGGQDELAQLIVLPNFDAIAASSPAVVARVLQTLVSLSAGDAGRLVQGMARLLVVQDAETRILRLRGVLSAIASLPQESLFRLTAEENHKIVNWAMELRGAASSIPGGQPFLKRLLATHIEGCAQNEQLKNSPELAHVRALFLSDLIALDSTAAEATAVLEQFSLALQRCTDAGDTARAKLVLRDRARYLLEQAEEGAALADYRQLFASELPLLEADPTSSSSVLDQRDLRRGGTLLAAAASGQPAGPRRLASGALALRVSEVLVQRPVWKLEPIGLRRQDLRDLTARALLQPDPLLLEQAALVFAKLPALPSAPLEGQPAPPLLPAPEGALWDGLVGTPAEHQELLDLSKQLVQRHAALLANESGPAKAGATPVDKNASGGEEASGGPDRDSRGS